MSFDNNPGFKILKQAFDRFAQKHDPAQLKPKATRAASNAAKAAIDAVEAEFPRKDVERVVEDIYQLLGGQDFTDGISQAMQNLDLSQIEEGLNKFVETLKDPQLSQSLATSVKMLSTQVPFGEVRSQIDEALGQNLPPAAQVILGRALDKFEEFYDNAKDMDVQDIARSIADFADSIPTRMVAQQAFAMLQFVTPETLAMGLRQVTSKLPQSQDVGSKYQAAFDAARAYVDETADKANAPRKPANDQKPANDRKPANDEKPAQPKPKKDGKGGGFKF